MIPRFIESRLRAWEPSFSPGLFKTILWSLAAGAIVVPLALVALPFVEFFNEMAAQPKAKALGTYGRVFGDESPVDFLPPVGSLPRGVEVWRFAGNDEQTAQAAAMVLKNPFDLAKLREEDRNADARRSMERGKKLFDIYCFVCHGPRGLGDGPVIGPDRYPAPTSLHDKVVAGYNDGRMYHVISEGKGKMPGYKDKIAPEDRWHVVNYVRALQRAMNPKKEDFQR